MCSANTLEASRRWNASSPRWVNAKIYVGKKLDDLSDTLLRGLPLSHHRRVLDIASGAGNPAIELAIRAGNKSTIYCLDISDAMLRGLKNNALNAGCTNIETIVGQMTSLPFGDSSFDLITSRLGIMFADPIEKAVDEFYRILRPGGLISFSVFGPRRYNGEYKILAKLHQKNKKGLNESNMFSLSNSDYLESVFAKRFTKIELVNLRTYRVFKSSHSAVSYIMQKYFKGEFPGRSLVNAVVNEEIALYEEDEGVFLPETFLCMRAQRL